MALTFYYHPFASFCQKVLISLYETGTAFEPLLVDLGDPQSRADFAKVWPIAKFPVLRDTERAVTIPESSIIIEYLDRHYPGAALVPADPDAVLQVRLWDRFFDNYVSVPMQRIVAESFRPSGDGQGVEEARAQLAVAYKLLDERMADREWATGAAFSMADCAAAPALYYARMVMPFDGHDQVAAYLQRLVERASFARVIEEARPYRGLFPVKVAETDWLDP